jgi:adenylate cyclase
MSVPGGPTSKSLGTRRLAAILVADAVGYSRQMGIDEARTLARMRKLRSDIVDPLMAQFGGRVFKTTGDGLLSEFPSAVEALRCALEIQSRNATQFAADPDAIRLRIGLHTGDVIVEDGDLLGDGVNVAARLEPLAEPGGICISGRVHEDSLGKVSLSAEDLGEMMLRNIGRPIRVFRVRKEAAEQSNVSRVLSLPDKPSIAVLPFQNMGADPEQEYFADGMVEEIITALSRIRSFFVIARNSSFAYKGKSPDVRHVGRDLGVRYVLEGSVRRAGDRVRLTGQLIDATNGNHIWADRFDGTLEDVFDLQDRMTGSIVGALETKLRTAEIERAQRKSTENLRAYDLMLRAVPHFRGMTRGGLDEAVRLLRQAIGIDPGYALAFAQLAWCHWAYVAQGWMDRGNPALTGMYDLTRTALELDSEDPEVLAAVAPFVAMPGGDYSAGISLIEKAINLNPNSATAFRTAGMLYAFGGDTRAAIDSLKQADRLNPLEGGVVFNHGYTLAYFVAGEHDSVIECSGRTLRDRANFMPALRYRAASFGLLDRREEGRQVIQRILEQVPDFTIAKARRHIEFDLNNGFKKPGVADAFYEGLRRSGAPEG